MGSVWREGGTNDRVCCGGEAISGRIGSGLNRSRKAFLRYFLPRTIRPRRILGGPLRGYRIVTSWHDYPAAITGSTERPLLNWFAQNVSTGETWLDIGAHYGYTAIALSRTVGASGRVFAFEPMLETAGYLVQTQKFNSLHQLRIVPMGLGSAETVELRRLPTVRGMADSTLGVDGPRETIMLARLDWLWPHICDGQRQIDGVKIDVQGMEIEAIRGMGDLLNTLRPKLVVEFHHAVDRNEFLNCIQSLGYSRRGVPIEPIDGEVEPQYYDDRSYFFLVQ